MAPEVSSIITREASQSEHRSEARGPKCAPKSEHHVEARRPVPDTWTSGPGAAATSKSEHLSERRRPIPALKNHPHHGTRQPRCQKAPSSWDEGAGSDRFRESAFHRDERADSCIQEVSTA